MKKYVIMALGVVFLIGITQVNLKVNNEKKTVHITLDNIEALSRVEDGDYAPCTQDGGLCIVSDEVHNVIILPGLSLDPPDPVE